MNCRECEGNIIQTRTEYVCKDCGLLSNEKLISNEVFYTEINTEVKKNSQQLLFKSNFNLYTNEEKTSYALNTYILKLCKEIDLQEYFIENVKNLSILVLNTIKKHDNSKRLNVKDSIILVCIQCVSKNQLDARVLAKKLGINIKYITKAEDTIFSLIHSKRLPQDDSLRSSCSLRSQ